jgi:hypothetical protein
MVCQEADPRRPPETNHNHPQDGQGADPASRGERGAVTRAAVSAAGKEVHAPAPRARAGRRRCGAGAPRDVGLLRDQDAVARRCS